MNADTQRSYVSLASNFYTARLDGLELTELNIIGALLRAAPEYRPDYFRRLRNALAFDQRLRGQFRIAQEINSTRNPLRAGAYFLPRKVKQTRARKISDENFSALVSALIAKGFFVEAGALMLIYVTGARPCELPSISISGQQIYIVGAKSSHSGLRGADRKLDVEPDVCNIAIKALAAFNSQPRSLDAVRMAIHGVAMDIFGNKKVPSMYTLRHQFGANLKASGMSRIEMAYVMGHQATDSISRYGDKRQGRADAVKVRPAADADLSAVRDTQWANTRKVPKFLAPKQACVA